MIRIKSLLPGYDFCVRVINDAALQWQLLPVNALRAGADANDLRIGLVVQINFNISTPISETPSTINATSNSNTH